MGIVKNEKQANILSMVLRVILPFAFIAENIYVAESMYNALPYMGYSIMDLPYWSVLIITGVLAFGLYYFISSFMYTMCIRNFVNISRQIQYIPFSKAVFKVNLDFCYLIGLLVLASFNFLYYKYSLSYLFVWLIRLVVVTIVVASFFLLLQKGVDKKYRRALLAGFLLPYAMLVIFV